MTKGAKTKYAVAKVAVFLFICSTFAYGGASCNVKGCNKYNAQNIALPQNQTIGIYVNGTVPATVDGSTGAYAQALSTINSCSGATCQNGQIGNGSGDTFAQYASQDQAALSVNSNSAIVQITFNTTDTTPPSCNGSSDVVGCSTWSGSGGTANYGTIVIYLNSQQCGGPCFNSNAPGYAAAVQGVIQHELYHGLGIGDTSSPGSIMSPYTVSSSGCDASSSSCFSSGGTPTPNNPAGTTTIQPCDNQTVQAAATARACGCSCGKSKK